MSSLSPPSESTQRPVLSRLVESIFSSADDNNVMMAAIVSLVAVILFVFLLHLYARTSFHSRSRRRRRRSIRPPPPSSSFVLDLAALSGAGAASKGLDPAAIAAIPLFVSGGDAAVDAECVVCLTEFDDGEVCRRLPKCGHEFHVECVDMWLGSHASCPICRAPAAVPDGGSASGADSADTAAIADRRDPRAAGDGDGAVLAIEIDDGDDNSTAENSSGGNGCSSSSPTTSFGCSLKRMLSRNRSEHKASPAASVVNAESTE